MDESGALYLAGPVLGWTLGLLAALSLYLGPAIRQDLRATGPVPPVVWAWILGMAVMLLPLGGCGIFTVSSEVQTVQAQVAAEEALKRVQLQMDALNERLAKTEADLAEGITLAEKSSFFNFTEGRILTLYY